MLSYDQLKERPRELLSATGLTRAEYESLRCAFVQAYEREYRKEQTQAKSARKRRAGGGCKGRLSCDSDKLLFILVYLKTNPLQTLHGLSFGLSQGQTNFWIHHLLPIVREALQRLGHTPEREAPKVKESALVHEGGAALLLDGTERRRVRPQDRDKQKAHYSGKKKGHTDKNLLLTNENSGKVAYLSPTVAGKTHDKKMADEAEIAYPVAATLAKDTGFQGYEPQGVFTLQPQKRNEDNP